MDKFFMGTWGSNIQENDIYADIYYAYFKLFDSSLSNKKIYDRLMQDFQDLLTDLENANYFWFAIGIAQWECGCLEDQILEKIKIINESGSDLALLESLGASQEAILGRRKEISNLLLKLQSKNLSPRKILKNNFCDSVFRKGDCISYKMDNGRFGGFFILKEEVSTVTGSNLVALTLINKSTIPLVSDFMSAQILIQRRKDFKVKVRDNKVLSRKEIWREHPCVFWTSANTFSSSVFGFQKVGTLSVNKDYRSKKINFGHLSWAQLPLILPFSDHYELINGSPITKSELVDWRLNSGIWRSFKNWLLQKF